MVRAGRVLIHIPLNQSMLFSCNSFPNHSTNSSTPPSFVTSFHMCRVQKACKCVWKSWLKLFFPEN